MRHLSRDLARGTRMPRRSSIVWPEGPDTRLLSSSLSFSFLHTRTTVAQRRGRYVWAPAGCTSLRFVVSLAPDMSRSNDSDGSGGRASERANERASRTVIIHSREPNIRRHTFASVSYRRAGRWVSSDVRILSDTDTRFPPIFRRVYCKLPVVRNVRVSL